MSCQPPPWSRRNVSPKQQPRPLRATLPVSLMRQHRSDSPTKNNTHTNESPPDLLYKSEDLDEARSSKEDLPRVFLGPGGEKSKTLNLRSQPQQHHIRRTSSLDALFLASQCKPETIYLGCFMVDKATQTPEEWNEMDAKATQRKSIVTGGEHLEVKYIRQKLQRTNQNSRAPGALFGAQRQSPIQGDHSAISTLGGNHMSAFGGGHKTTHGSMCRAQGKKVLTPRLQSSLEGLNQEIEKIVLKDSCGFEQGNSSRLFEPTPEGHRAPIAELFHSIKNQPESGTSSGTASRSHSISPSIPIIPGVVENSNSPSNDDNNGLYKLGSPHINEFLTREPPDGCEKVKMVDEPQRGELLDLSAFTLIKPQQVYVLLPSQSSAFCPLYKNLNPPTTLAYNVLPPTQMSPKCHK